MTAEPYIPWEDRPACWGWDPPLLPQPNDRRRLVTWQNGRCAICGDSPSALFDDHDHATGDTRGYLCPSCNGLEGISPKSIYENYRLRPPVAILGIRLKYKLNSHPEIQAQERAWGSALERLTDRADEIISVMYSEQHRLESPNLHSARTEQYVTPMSPLMRAALNVGLTEEEWEATRDLMEDWKWDRRQGDPLRTPAEATRKALDDPECQVKLLRWALNWSDTDRTRVELQNLYGYFHRVASNAESALGDLRRRAHLVPDALAADDLMSQALRCAQEAAALLEHAVEQYDADRVDRSPAHVLAEVLG